MEPRIPNLVAALPGLQESVLAVNAVTQGRGVPEATLALCHLRASQINGCSACIHGGVRQAKQAGETDDRLFTVAGWRDAPFFTDAERAALALTECVTRLSDRSDPVPDGVWAGAARHYDDTALAALVLHLGLTNLFNRLKVATRQVAGSWG